jgi:hypothetical protein
MSDNQAKVWRYVLHNVGALRCGWAIILLDDTGTFTAVSDYGNYAFRWTSFGPNFRQFLSQINDGYLMSKITFGWEHKIDLAATSRGIKDYILEQRRSRDLSKEAARDEWDLVELNLEDDNQCGFQDWCASTEIGDSWEFAVDAVDRDAEAFVEHVWPRFVELLEADLEGACDKCHGAGRIPFEQEHTRVPGYKPCDKCPSEAMQAARSTLREARSRDASSALADMQSELEGGKAKWL